MLDLQVIQESLENMNNLKKLNKEQKKYLSDRGFYYRLNYYADSNLCLSMSKDAFRNFEYYLGMEYVREYILIRIEDGTDIYVEYEPNDRVESLFERLEELEEVEE